MFKNSDIGSKLGDLEVFKEGQELDARPSLVQLFAIYLAPTGPKCWDCLAMDFGGVGATQQGMTDSCQSGCVPTSVQNLAPHAAVAAAVAPAIAPYKEPPMSAGLTLPLSLCRHPGLWSTHRGRSPRQLLYWPQHRPKNRSRRWENVCPWSSKPCIRAWPGRFEGCCWGPTKLRCCSGCSLQSLSLQGGRGCGGSAAHHAKRGAAAPGDVVAAATS